MKTISTVALTAILTAAACVTATDALATSSSGVSTRILANKVPFDAFAIHAHTTPAAAWGLNLETHGVTDGYVVDNVIQPGGTTGWHSHPGPSMIFVIKGTVTNFTSDDPACAGVSYAAGSGFIDAGGADAHTLKNLGDVPAETIAVQLLPQDAPRKTDADVPANCVG